ncbi:hypothetical protein [Streptomyces sp. NPDC001536]|uniref:hypothetical protein n=1 Tax=Streptomyces sp. NPDC001536 TaxID=3364583 RepID=UPI0036B32A22
MVTVTLATTFALTVALAFARSAPADHSALPETVSTLLLLLPDLERRRDELKLERGRFNKARQQAESLSADIGEDFHSLPIERKRALILHSLSAVLIHPAGKGRRKFDPSLIEPIWR